MGRTNSMQMPSPRRTRSICLTGLILGFLVLYYLGGLDVLVGRDRVIQPDDASHHVVPDEHILISSDPLSSTKTTSSAAGIIPQTSSHLELQTTISQTTSSTLAVKPTPTSTHPASQKESLSPNEVLLIIKTGASTIWRRMPLHLTTTLSTNTIPHHVIYSDLSEQLSSNITTIDILANISSLIQHYDPSAYAAYLDQKLPSHVNTYREHAQLPGDEPFMDVPGNQPGWLLDKYKFLPMLEHAAKNWAGKKWVIYIEDDTYIFWSNTLSYLSTLNPDSSPSYYGAYSGEGNQTFAQGGSGLVFSRSLMTDIFSGNDIPTLEKYGNETSKACCGDTMLGKVLRDYGVYVNKGGYGTSSWRPEPPWRTGFDDLVWCTPVFTFHHLHQKDILQLSELERRKREEDTKRPVIFRDVYMEFIAPYLTKPMLSNWDNFASRYVLSGVGPGVYPEALRSVDASILEAASSSPEGCHAACLAVPSCMGWRHESAIAKCSLDTVVKLGREPDPQPKWETKTVITSGWMLERIDKLFLREECKIVKEPYI